MASALGDERERDRVGGVEAADRRALLEDGQQDRREQEAEDRVREDPGQGGGAVGRHAPGGGARRPRGRAASAGPAGADGPATLTARCGATPNRPRQTAEPGGRDEPEGGSGRPSTAATSSSVGRKVRPAIGPVHVADDARRRRPRRPSAGRSRAGRGCRRPRPPPCPRRPAAGRRTRPACSENSSWLSTDCGLMASTWAPTSAKLVDVVGVGVELAGADRRVVARVEDQHHRPGPGSRLERVRCGGPRRCCRCRRASNVGGRSTDLCGHASGLSVGFEDARRGCRSWRRRPARRRARRGRR